MPRWVLAMGVALALSGCVTRDRPVLTEPLVKTDMSRGCLGANVKECLALLADQIQVVDYNLAIETINRGIPDDVNGRPVAKKGVVILGIVGKEGRYSGAVSIDYTPEGTVTSFTYEASAGLFIVRTPEEYQTTKIYEMTVAALGRTCDVTADRMTTYRFFENAVKPSLSRAETEKVKNTVVMKDVSVRNAQPVPICGRHLTATAYAGRDLETKSQDNRFGFFASQFLKFE